MPQLEQPVDTKANFYRTTDQMLANEKQKQVDALSAELNTYKNRPKYPTMVKATNEQGMLLDPFKIKGQGDVNFRSNMGGLEDRLSGIDLNTEGLEAIRSRALSQGPSSWADLMLQRQGLEESTALDRAARTSAGQTASAWADLMSSGGMSAGARERIARQGANAGMAARQEARRAGQLDRLGILGQDEQDKLSLLKGLPGMEVEALRPEFEKASMWSSLADSEARRGQELDVANRSYKTEVDRLNAELGFRERNRQSTFDLGKYAEEMKGYAAERDAEAVASQGGGTWICTEVNRHHPWTQKQWRTLKKFKVHCFKTDAERTKFYFDLGDDILPDLKAKGFDFSPYRESVEEVIQAFDAGNYELAKDIYWEMIGDVIQATKKIAA